MWLVPFKAANCLYKDTTLKSAAGYKYGFGGRGDGETSGFRGEIGLNVRDLN
jgi:hypothetical protein